MSALPSSSSIPPAPLPGGWVSPAGGVWGAAWARFSGDRVGLVSLAVVLAFALLVIAAGTGLVGRDWQREVGVPNAPPTWLGPQAAEAQAAIKAPSRPNVDLSDVDPLAPHYAEWAERAARFETTESARAETLPFGGDRMGRDVLAKAVKGAEVSIKVGVLAALIATLIGTVLGALSGFLRGWVDDVLEWVYNVFTSIPGILLVLTFAAVLNQADAIVPRGVWTLVVILGLTGWPGIYRLVRAEFMKHAVREYVRAAEAIGASAFSRMFRHILPNVSHVVLVQLSVYVVGFIKGEVILSYLGLGVAVDEVSWGTMLAEAQSELILGHWWQLAAATLFMAVFVTAFSLFTDALRDALDPKLRGLE